MYPFTLGRFGMTIQSWSHAFLTASQCSCPDREKDHRALRSPTEAAQTLHTKSHSDVKTADATRALGEGERLRACPGSLCGESPAGPQVALKTAGGHQGVPGRGLVVAGRMLGFCQGSLRRVSPTRHTGPGEGVPFAPQQPARCGTAGRGGLLSLESCQQPAVANGAHVASTHSGVFTQPLKEGKSCHMLQLRWQQVWEYFCG